VKFEDLRAGHFQRCREDPQEEEPHGSGRRSEFPIPLGKVLGLLLQAFETRKVVKEAAGSALLE